jgi:hypothetical protein
MGEATDRKLSEIAATRRRLDADIRELEGRLPAPLRSVKTIVGSVVGSSVLSALALRMMKRRSNHKKDATEVVVRVVRDDEPAAARRH